ncbi:MULTISPECIES: AAA family ATPase [unclassified Janthinobacterium]|uniref:AAA family ATPase n=1 Tax=unclassified Janthinobacterium TaxID=2610881 RepID=UPI00160840ED|nr:MULTISPECIES: AAA family ATPase [unclassified Janthinobacterium]MBB5370270.1 pilus assembly protein CpaE [Janthinobacterium sp. K2C7]MBB5383076.1 pilus assembly protein CpaE [Janthinobacterium sp. K2Li3]MBB5388445.1 pilus assembly protein CpaE [Janthinobacterium sp. K2E3]
MKALMITRDATLHEEIAAQGAARMPVLRLLERRSGLRDAVEHMLAEAPELVIVDASGIGLDEADLLERLARQYPLAALMLLTRGQQQDVLIRAMRAGTREVLQLPLVHKAFHEAMDRVDIHAGVTQMRDGKVLAFISCKGGSGATFLSTNFSYALATLAGCKVLLIDLHGQFGDATLYVSDQKPAMTLSDICSQITRMDGAFLASCLVHVTPNFGVLAAADDPAHKVDMQPEHMDRILAVARHHYDYIVLDVERQIDALSLRALDSADAIYPVLQLALPDIRHGRRLLDIFRSLGYPGERLRLIVNRYEKGGRLRLADLEQALGAEVVHTVPNDYLAATDSVNQGIPLLQLSRSSAVARSLADLVELVTARRVAESRGLFDRLFSRNEV